MNYYFICFALTLIVTIAFFCKQNSHHTLDLSTFYIFACFSTLGFWQRSLATVLEQAVLAQQIIYAGGCYATLSQICTTLVLCKLKISRKFKITLFVLVSFIFGSTLTIGYLPYYYKHAYLVFENGNYRLLYEYGILHPIMYILLIASYLVCFFALIMGIKKKKEVSIGNVIKLLLIMGTGIISYCFGRRFFSVELLPSWYVITSCLLYVIDDKIILYNVDKTVADSLRNINQLGFVSFDMNYRFLGCNDYAKKIYPPLEHLFVDRKIDSTNPELQELSSWIDFFKRNIKSEFYYKKSDRYFKVMQNKLFSGNRERGYQLVFTDCTEEKNRESKLIQISITDELTKIFNRRAFEEEIEKIQTDGIPDDFTIISFDLNGLKKANDTIGHAAGDELIIGSATCLNSVLEQYGYVYRTGGDEFIAIAICGKEELDDMFNQIEEKTKSWQGEYSKGLSISKGAASHSEYPDHTLEELEKEAEKRMYSDKNRYYVETGLERRRV